MCSGITLNNSLEVMFTAPTGQGTQILSDNETCTAGCVLAAGRILKSHMVVELLAQDAAPAGVAGLGATSTGVSGSILSPEVVPIPTLQPVGLVILTALTLATGRVALRKQRRR